MATQLTAILPNRGREAVADAVSRRPLHLAWGLGDGAWLDAPPPDIDAADLIAEAGRRIISDWKFVVPDDDGDIVVDTGGGVTGRFRLSEGNAVTQHLYINCQFDFTDGVGLAVREVALFTNTVAEPVTPGQRYFTPDQITEKGILVYLQNIAPIFRSSATQEYFETVITF